MAHAPGWIELYEALEAGRRPPTSLVELCMAGRTEATRETMLHWYVIEGAPEVVSRLIELGFDVDEADSGGTRPLGSAALLRRWDMVRLLRGAGASARGVNSWGESYRTTLQGLWGEVPEDLRVDLYSTDDLLLPAGPEDSEVSGVWLFQPDSTAEPRLSLGEWAELCERDPLISRTADRPFEAFLHLPGEEELCLCALSPKGDLEVPGPCLRFYSPSAQARRVIHRVAQHFSARTYWTFACG